VAAPGCGHSIRLITLVPRGVVPYQVSHLVSEALRSLTTHNQEAASTASVLITVSCTLCTALLGVDTPSYT
jgi:hypothetical protein